MNNNEGTESDQKFWGFTGGRVVVTEGRDPIMRPRWVLSVQLDGQLPYYWGEQWIQVTAFEEAERLQHRFDAVARSAIATVNAEPNSGLELVRISGVVAVNQQMLKQLQERAARCSELENSKAVAVDAVRIEVRNVGSHYPEWILVAVFPDNSEWNGSDGGFETKEEAMVFLKQGLAASPLGIWYKS